MSYAVKALEDRFNRLTREREITQGEVDTAKEELTTAERELAEIDANMRAVLDAIEALQQAKGSP